jgi:hypothetical protein
MPDDLATRRKKARERFDQLMRAALVLILLDRLKIISDARAFVAAFQLQLADSLHENFMQDRTPLQRETTRDALQDAFDEETRRLASSAALARSLEEVEPWLLRMAAATATHSLAQFALGAGRSLMPSEYLAVGDLVGFDWSKLDDFAALIFEKASADDAVSANYVAARSQLYGGTGRALWYAGDELGAGFGVVIDYFSRDDAGTCSPCLIAEEESPYLPGEGPFPGMVCKGRGRCRCYRQPRDSMTEYLRLISIKDRRSRFLEF